MGRVAENRAVEVGERERGGNAIALPGRDGPKHPPTPPLRGRSQRGVERGEGEGGLLGRVGVGWIRTNAKCV